MGIYKKYIICLFVSVIIGLPCFSIGAWKDAACRVVTCNNACVSVSDNYKLPYCVGENVDYAQSCIVPINTNKFSTAKSEISTRDIIEQYCLSLFSGSNAGRIYFAKSSNSSNDFNWQQTFDSHQSLFLHALCSSFTDGEGNMPFINDNDLLGDVYKGDLVKTLNLQQISNKKDGCSLSSDSSLNECDIGIYATKIFAGIMSDVYKIKYAQVLDIDAVGKIDMNKKIEMFMNGYFGVNGLYKDIKKNYKKTVSVLESNQKYYKNVLDTVRIIDNEELATLASKSKCSSGGNVTGINFVACALHSSQGNGVPLTPSFVTLVYNEVLHYRHFVTYYMYSVQKKLENDKNLKSDKKLVEESKLWDFQRYAEMQIEAFQLVQNDFEEFSMTYPLHIWLLMYIEKAENFRNDFAKIITLFYSLSEKLQNVQQPS